jgi:carboxymethylenebutenolidase
MATTRTITFQRPDGKECSGYLCTPTGGGQAPGVVVIQEWWGLNDQIGGVAERLASEGYRTLVPDLYRGRVTPEAAEASHLMQGLNFADAAGQDVRGAVQHLENRGGGVAVLGFCMGGALSILAAVLVPEVDALVCWYGVPPLDALDLTKITAPVQGHFALQDHFFPPAQVDELERRLRAAGARHEFHRYQAKHAFGNENNPDHDPEATRLAWRRSLDFLALHLRANQVSRTR